LAACRKSTKNLDTPALTKYLLSALGCISFSISSGQKILDPCFTSIKTLGFFYGSADLVNVCDCSDNYVASDLIQWNGTQWEGALEQSNLTIEPPPGCNLRAIWMGNKDWTRNGEAIGLRLDKPLETDKPVSFKFTYASAGRRSDQHFAPKIYTSSTKPGLMGFNNYHFVGTLPPANGWQTDSITFITTAAQAGDSWVIIHAEVSSGIILGSCDFPESIPKDFLNSDALFCSGQTFNLVAPAGKDYTYEWNTGSSAATLNTLTPGTYGVTVKHGFCTISDSVTIEYSNCEVRLEMPTIFTPNGDELNANFIPIEYNYIETGTTTIHNRWGDLVFKGDLFTGWDGTTNGKESVPGVYFYRVIFIDRNGKEGMLQGPVTLMR
jgi:gliding motility-associated-like protein